MTEWIAPERLYLNSKNAVVTGTDPDKQRLLVGAGGALPWAVAQRYGLIAPPVPPPEATEAPATKALRHPPATKARRGPETTK